MIKWHTLQEKKPNLDELVIIRSNYEWMWRYYIGCYDGSWFLILGYASYPLTSDFFSFRHKCFFLHAKTTTEYNKYIYWYPIGTKEIKYLNKQLKEGENND